MQIMRVETEKRMVRKEKRAATAYADIELDFIVRVAVAVKESAATAQFRLAPGSRARSPD